MAKVDTPRRPPTTEQRVILLLSTALLANPFILFLLTRSVVLAAALVVLCTVVLQVAASPPVPRLAAAYMFNLLALLSLFAHAEVIIVHAFPDYVPENLYTIHNGFYFNRPLLTETFTSKEYSVHYYTNAQGLRIGVSQDPERTTNTADWLVLGDSYTQGAQVEFEELFSTKLYARFPDKVVVNAGISGFGVGHEYHYFLTAGRKFNPSLVILQLCSFNDFMNVEPTLVGFSDRLMTHSAFIRFLLADFKSRNPAALPLGRWTEPFQRDNRANVDYNVFYKASSTTKERDLADFTRYLTELKHAVDGAGARLLVVLIPTKEQVYPRYLEEVLREFEIQPNELNMQRPNDFLRALATRLNIPFVDLLEDFKKAGGPVFFDYDEHMTPLGHQVMADAVAKCIEKMIGRSRATLLSEDFAGDRYPMLSSDGTLLSYQSPRDRNMELFVAGGDLATRRRLTFDDVDESHPMLSRDNTKVLFTEGSAESMRTEVVVMSLDGSARTVLTSGPDVFGAIPTFSPSNASVAYAEWIYDASARSYSHPRIAVVDLVSGTKEIVTPPDRESWRPVFSPEGARLAYISKALGKFDLYVYDLTTRTERRLTETPFDEWDPFFAPDGRIVYSAKRDGNWDLFVIDPSNRGMSRLTETRGDEWDASVTPDGASVLFGGRFGLIEGIYRMAFR